MPKVLVQRLLAPALALPEGVQLVCREDKTDRLLAALSVHELDVVLADAPMGPEVRVKAFNHVLGESGVSLLGARPLAARLRRTFPGSLHQAPVLMPAEHTTLRRSIDQWFDAHQVRPRLVAEFDDSALMKAFAQSGAGVIPAPTVVERDACRQYGLGVVGRLDDVRERFYAISVEKRLKHPAVVAISEAARHDLFGSAGA